MYFGFKNITIDYGKRDVIRDLTLEIPQGKIVTIIGQNGCGKSSLLKTVSRAVVPKCGNVIFEGKKIEKYPRKYLAQRIAYLAQTHKSPEDIDVRTLVSYGRYPYTRFGKRSTHRDEEIIDKALTLTGLKALEKRILTTLSGGERQRAWIAMAICQEPEILILDEPTTYLDISYQVEVLETVKKLNEELNITIIMVLHDLNLAARYSDYLYAIKDGNIYAAGEADVVMTEKNLEEIFEIQAAVFEDELNHCPYFIPLKKIIRGEAS